MLIEFRFSNYRSFRDENVLSMEKRGISDPEDGIITFEKYRLLPSMAIFGKNGGGKSNLIRAFWLGVQFITNAQRTQHENSAVPVRPFLLSEDSSVRPTAFEYTFIENGLRYIYGFSATMEHIDTEYLYYYPGRNRATIFTRKGQDFYFPAGSDKRLKELISKAVAPNQLFFAIASTMNYEPCIRAMNWFRSKVIFSRDYADLPTQIMMNINNEQILSSMKKYAMEADVGIENMQFEINDRILETADLDKSAPDMPEEVRRTIEAFMQALNASPDVSEASMKKQELKVTTFHRGIDAEGESKLYEMSLSDESDGTRRIMALAPAIEKILHDGGLFIIDEIELGVHPLIVNWILEKIQNAADNPNHAQIIFTTHDSNLMKFDILRRDQVAFVDKDRETGVSELYQIRDIRDFSGRSAENSYLAGKFGAVPELNDGDLL